MPILLINYIKNEHKKKSTILDRGFLYVTFALQRNYDNFQITL